MSALLENWRNWQPSPKDIAWTQAHINRLADGAKWVTSEGIFIVDKANKTLHWYGFDLAILDRVRKCCEKMGWQVILLGENPDEKSFSM